MVAARGPYKILVVDDEPDVEPLLLQRMRRKIRSGQYQFVFAHNGVDALEKLNKYEGIDMVLSDINMPQMDGLTLLEQIPDVDPNIRAVIISAYGDMKNIRTAMNRGAFDFVTKPLDFDDLQVTIERTLNHVEEWREALSSRDKLVALQNELDIASQMQQSILPTAFPKTSGLPSLRQHGARAQRGRGLLRCSALGEREDRPRHRRCLGQGRARRSLYDVQPHAVEGRGNWQH